MDQLDNSEVVVQPVKVGSAFSIKGLGRVITAPTRFFEELKDNPRVLMPMLGMAGVMALYMFALQDVMLDLQIEAMRASGTSEAQIRMMSEGSMRLIQPIMGVLFVMLIPLVTGAVAKFFGGFVMGGKADYWKVVSVMAYSEFLYFLTGLVSLPIQIYKQTVTPPFSLAVLAPDLSIESPLFVFLAKVSVSYAWEIVVAGIGLSILFKFSRNKGYLLAVLTLGGLSVFHIGMAAVGQMMR